MKNKVIAFFVIITMLIAIVPINVFARMDTDIDLGSSGAQHSSEEMTRRLLGVAQVIGSVVSVAALVIIGLRYIFSSIEEKASMKGVLVYYIIGAVLVFATSNILGIAYDTINGWGKGTSASQEATGGSTSAGGTTSGSGAGITNPGMSTRD